MEFFLLSAVVLGVVAWWIWKERKSEQAGNHPLESFTKKLDVNNDGKVDVADAKVIVAEVKETAIAAADVNKDGKVDVEDVKVVVEKTKKTVAKAKAKVKATTDKVKKTTKTKGK